MAWGDPASQASVTSSCVGLCLAVTSAAPPPRARVPLCTPKPSTVTATLPSCVETHRGGPAPPPVLPAVLSSVHALVLCPQCGERTLSPPGHCCDMSDHWQGTPTVGPFLSPQAPSHNPARRLPTLLKCCENDLSEPWLGARLSCQHLGGLGRRIIRSWRQPGLPRRPCLTKQQKRMSPWKSPCPANDLETGRERNACYPLFLCKTRAQAWRAVLGLSQGGRAQLATGPAGAPGAPQHLSLQQGVPSSWC